MSRISDKRVRLLQAASRLIHEVGLPNATLARIAHEAGIPLGNVYYYFRSKEELWRAVLDSRTEQIRDVLDRAATTPEPKSQLIAFTEYFREAGDDIARFGCPFGGLGHEMSREAGVSRDLRSAPLAEMLTWTEGRFTTLGAPKKDARRQAGHLVAAIQGASLLAHSLGDPKILRREIRVLQRWIETL